MQFSRNIKKLKKNYQNKIQLETHKLIELNKEYSELTPIVEIIKKFNKNK